MKKVNVILVFVAALLLSCTTAFAEGGVVHVLLTTDTEYNRVLSSVSQVSPSNLGDFALELYYDEGNCYSGPKNTDYPIDVRGVEIRLYSGKHVLEVVDQYGDRHFVGYYVGDNFHIYWSDSAPGDILIDEDTPFSEQIALTLQGIARQVARIDQALTAEDGPFALWMSLLDVDLDLVNITLEQIYLRLQSLSDYVELSSNGVVTLVGKMDELIEAVNGISISADGSTISFNTLPITDRLDTLISSFNETLYWIMDIASNVQKLAWPGESDDNPIRDRLDTIIYLLENIGDGGFSGDGSDDPLSPERCEHYYLQSVLRNPTCTMPGLVRYICIYCGDSYPVISETFGHSWMWQDTITGDYDPVTGEGSPDYDLYICENCGAEYHDYEMLGAVESGDFSISGIVIMVFEKIGKLAGDLVSMIIGLLDKLLAGFDQIVTSFNEKTQEIISFGGAFPMWLSGLWLIVPSDLQLAFTFCVIVFCLGIIGKKVVFSL